jgi:hypothetical protein
MKKSSRLFRENPCRIEGRGEEEEEREVDSRGLNQQKSTGSRTDNKG